MRARISLKEAGIDPEMKFSCSVKSSSPLSFASCSGTVPLNLFAPRRSVIRFANFPMKDGMVPLILLS